MLHKSPTLSSGMLPPEGTPPELLRVDLKKHVLNQRQGLHLEAAKPLSQTAFSNAEDSGLLKVAGCALASWGWALHHPRGDGGHPWNTPSTTLRGMGPPPGPPLPYCKVLAVSHQKSDHIT